MNLLTGASLLALDKSIYYKYSPRSAPEIHNFFGDHAYIGNRTSKSCNHITEAAGISKTSQKHTQSFSTITYTPLLALNDRMDTQSMSQPWNFLFFDRKVSYTLNRVQGIEVKEFVVFVWKLGIF